MDASPGIDDCRQYTPEANKIQGEDERLSSSTERVKRNFKEYLLDIISLLLFQDTSAFQSFLLSERIKHLIPTEDRSRIPKADKKELQEISARNFKWFSQVFPDEVRDHLTEKADQEFVLSKLAAMKTMVHDYFNSAGRAILDKRKNILFIVFDSSYDGISSRQLEELYMTALEATDLICDPNMTIDHCNITAALIMKEKMYDKPIEESQRENNDTEELCTLRQGHRRKRQKLNNTKTVSDTCCSYTKHFVSPAEAV